MNAAKPVSRKVYARLKKRLERFETWRNGRTSYESGSVPKGLDVSNEERSQIEVYEFVSNPPAKYFAYIRRVDCEGNASEKSLRIQVTTWTGQVIGTGLLGTSFRDNFGGHRYPLRFRGINGLEYAGTYYASAGDYARVKAIKKTN